jgi:hypothetical protein
MKQTHSLAQLLKQAIDNRLLDVHTALIAKVESYDAEKQQVNVSPALKRHLRNIEGKWISEQLPIMCDVPVLFPRSGGYFIHLPIRSGDFVQLIFNEVSINEWMRSETSNITSDQRFTLQGAVAIPGICPETRAPIGVTKNNLVLGKENGPQIHIDDKKIRLGSANAKKALAIAGKVEKELNRIIEAFNNHTHTSNGAIPIPPLPGANSVASKDVVAE